MEPPSNPAVSVCTLVGVVGANCSPLAPVEPPPLEKLGIDGNKMDPAKIMKMAKDMENIDQEGAGDALGQLSELFEDN